MQITENYNASDPEHINTKDDPKPLYGKEINQI